MIFDILSQPCFDQGLVGHVSFVGFNLDAIKQHFWQPQGYGFGGLPSLCGACLVLK
jgi:hypothetical protein